MKDIKNNFILKPVYFLKYFFWYLILNSLITFALYHEGIINIPSNDNILPYIFFHDIFKQSILFILSILGIHSLDFFFNKKILFQEIIEIDGNLKKRFILFIIDIVALFFISSLSVVIKLGDVSELTSLEKFELIWYLAIVILIIKLLIWFAKVTIRVELLRFLDVILLLLQLPIDLINSFIKEVNASTLSNQVKKTIKVTLVLICSVVFAYILYH